MVKAQCQRYLDPFPNPWLCHCYAGSFTGNVSLCLLRGTWGFYGMKGITPLAFQLLELPVSLALGNMCSLDECEKYSLT